MNRCAVTAGFFVLGQCDQAAARPCARCERPVCAGHLRPGDLCPDCAAAQGPQSDDAYDPAWIDRYRRHYYEHSSRVYNDAAWYSTIDAHERGAFDAGDDWSYGGGDFEGDSGFVDS
ncbi:hypothetical protein [Actinomadura hibisca]|uniref:hypothetical protein n=1 Tax=Actinomadura hibisca TaxID=68565 RepID=UPI000A813C26|nr:hypothetical protein [Actinomadura hibisca]